MTAGVPHGEARDGTVPGEEANKPQAPAELQTLITSRWKGYLAECRA